MAGAAQVQHDEVDAKGANLPALARTWLKRCGGDATRATALLQQSLERNGDLLREIIKAAISDAVGLHVQGAVRNERAAIMAQTTGSGRDGVIALASGLSRALLDMPLAGGLKLREATRADVLDQATRYQSQASDMHRKSRWLVLIAQSVPNDAVVGDVLTDKRASELWAEVA